MPFAQMGCRSDPLRVKRKGKSVVKVSRQKSTKGLRARLAGQSGQSAVELLIAIPIVLFVLGGIVDFGRHYHARLTLRNAVSEAARFAVTGQTLVDSLGNPLTRAESIVKTIQDKAADLNVAVSDLTITPPDGGGPGQIVTINATYRFYFVMPGIKQLFGGGYVDFASATSVLNEPF